MCLGWKFKLGAFCGTRCWVEMAILAFLLWPREGADQNARTQENDEPSGSVGGTGGWGHISRVTKRSAYLNLSSTPCRTEVAFYLRRHSCYRERRIVEIDHCAWYAAQGRNEMRDPQAFWELLYLNRSSRLGQPSTLSGLVQDLSPHVQHWS